MGRSILSVVVASVCVSGVLADPPQTVQDPVAETLHGVDLVDPYRWLEGDNSDPENMGLTTSEVAAWTDAQNAYTRGILDDLPGRSSLESRLRELMEVGSVSSPIMRRNRYFYSQREGDQNQAVIYVREGFDGSPRELLDPNRLDEEGLETISWYVPNHQGTLLAFGKYRAGDENSTLFILDVDTGKWLADEIPGKVGACSWMPDSSGFFYRGLADINNPYSGRICYHEVGTHASQDAVLFEQYKTGEWAKSWGPSAEISRDGRWMLLGYFKNWSANDLWAVDLDRWFRTGEFRKVPIVTDVEARSWGPIVGDTLYLRTNLDAPNGRVVAVDLNNPERDGWNDVIPERAGAVLEEISIARGILVGQYLKNASTRIELFRMDGTPAAELELPGLGSAGISTLEDRTEAFLTFTSYNEPRSIYRVDLATGERWLWERPEVPVDPSNVEVKQVWYESKDGTKVSMFVVYKKGLELDGDNPTVLSGYGGFNISETPRFSATLFPWFDAGGVFAVANLRGGGEYGEAWHKAGMLDKKQNVFDDFHAAAEWLIENRYTKSERLGISGGSNGGLLVGAAVTQRPELYRAALSAVPLLDMIRYQSFLMARYWVGEYGSSENADQFKYLMEYSPYQNVESGIEYPSVFFTAAENDTRVHPLHARKMAARMQAATTSDPTIKPILLRVERDAGHGAGKPLHLRLRDVTDSRIYFMWQLGMLDGVTE